MKRCQVIVSADDESYWICGRAAPTHRWSQRRIPVWLCQSHLTLLELDEELPVDLDLNRRPLGEPGL